MQAQLSEFNGSGRQSRIAIKGRRQARATWTFTGYYEMDWLGSGITSNNNQSNSYVVRVSARSGHAPRSRAAGTSAAARCGRWRRKPPRAWKRHGNSARHHRPAVYRGLRMGPPVRLPRRQGIRQQFWLGVSLKTPRRCPAGSGAEPTSSWAQPGDGGGLYNSTANYSFNKAPDFVAKMAFEPGWGHWELFGIARFFENRIYPTRQPDSARSTTTR